MKKASKWLLSQVYFRTGNSVVLPTIQRAWPRNLEGDWTPHDNAFVFKESKFTSILADVNDPMIPSHSRFSCALFAVCVDYDVSWCVNQNFLNNLWSSEHEEWRRSVRVFFFCSIVPSVGNVRIRTAILIRPLGCLNIANANKGAISSSIIWGLLCVAPSCALNGYARMCTCNADRTKKSVERERERESRQS